MGWGGYESTDAFLSVLSRIPTVPLTAGSMSSVLIKVELVHSHIDILMGLTYRSDHPH